MVTLSSHKALPPARHCLPQTSGFVQFIGTCSQDTVGLTQAESGFCMAAQRGEREW